jgi:methionine sulfoxide reductase heme-binding subunit
MLLLALAITPALTIFRWRRLIVVRRMIGVTALAYTVAHIIMYFALRFWDFAHIAHEMVTRVSLIVATAATIGLVALGVTSTEAAVRRMGAKAWQHLHNLIYAFAALALVHYLLSPEIYPEQYLMSGVFFWLMVWRLLNRHERGVDIGALSVLAVASSFFTALLEAGWIWVYHGYAPSTTLANNFELVLGIAPAWQILALGLVVAVAAAVRRTQPFRPARADARETG